MSGAEVAAGTLVGTWAEDWHAALRAVELDVQDAEELLRRVHEGQDLPEEPVVRRVPPPPSGRIPVEMAEQARRLLERQVDVSARLARAMAHSRSEATALRKFDRAESGPIFWDQVL